MKESGEETKRLLWASHDSAAEQAGYEQGDSDVDLDRTWVGIAAEVWARPVGPVERIAGRLLGSPGLARALVTTPSLVASWIMASAVVLAIGALVTRSTGVPWVALLAPALTGVGFAYAYGPGIDPAFELSQTMAISHRLILCARALAVFAVNAVCGLVASLASADVVGLTLGWLVPMTMVAALGLAAATMARSAIVGSGAALSAWGLIVLGAALDTHDLATAVAQARLIPGYVVGTVVCGGLALYATRGTMRVRG